MISSPFCFHTLTNCPFCQPFILKFMHRMGVGGGGQRHLKCYLKPSGGRHSELVGTIGPELLDCLYALLSLTIRPTPRSNKHAQGGRSHVPLHRPFQAYRPSPLRSHTSVPQRQSRGYVPTRRGSQSSRWHKSQRHLFLCRKARSGSPAAPPVQPPAKSVGRPRCTPRRRGLPRHDRGPPRVR